MLLMQKINFSNFLKSKLIVSCILCITITSMTIYTAPSPAIYFTLNYIILKFKYLTKIALNFKEAL